MGWAGAVVVILLVGRWLAALLDVGPHRTPPDWVAYVRLVIGLVLVVSAAWIWRRADRRVQQMAAARGPAQVVAAAPQLPALLRSVETFRPLRACCSAALCSPQPVDLACVLRAALEISLADVATSGAVLASVLFVAGCSATWDPWWPSTWPGRTPRSARSRRAELDRRDTRTLNAGLLLLIGCSRS